MGCSVDHIIMDKANKKTRQERLDITKNLAKECFELHHDRGYTFELFGVAQGWDIRSYNESVDYLKELGYERICLGGLVGLKTVSDRPTELSVVSLLQNLAPKLEQFEKVHVFGRGDLTLFSVYKKTGVTQFDNNIMRKSWADEHRSYMLYDPSKNDMQYYTAIRIPLLSKDPGISEMEKPVFEALKAFDEGRMDRASFLDVLRTHVSNFNRNRKNPIQIRPKYLMPLLKDKPWTKCECEICREDGIHVDVFRRRMRNTRRAFHNVYNYYQYFKTLKATQETGVRGGSQRSAPGQDIGSITEAQDMSDVQPATDLITSISCKPVSKPSPKPRSDNTFEASEPCPNAARILVIGSCTKKKRYTDTMRAHEVEFPAVDDQVDSSKRDLFRHLDQYQVYSCAAKDMYIGAQQKLLLEGIRLLRRFSNVDYYILSAGFGLLNENDCIPCYESTFSGLTKKEISEKSRLLGIPDKFSSLVTETHYDLIYYALGSDYFAAIPGWAKMTGTLAIAFEPVKNPNVISIKTGNTDVKLLKELGFKTHGVNAFKGAFLKILALNLDALQDPSSQLKEILARRERIRDFIAETVSSKILN
jgi:hypothetical protein